VDPSTHGEFPVAGERLPAKSSMDSRTIARAMGKTGELFGDTVCKISDWEGNRIGEKVSQ
jgi:hypothetical protein